ncbi:MAG: GNAT family N-acetyltransferase [Brachybacterium tyrofermentans]
MSGRPQALRETRRLQLDAPREADLEDLHRIYSDARTWSHLPSGRFADLATTCGALDRWLEDWTVHGLGAWVAREGGVVVGHGGCAVRQDAFWNLGYRFAPEAQGRGLATELSQAAITAALEARPELPVVVYLLEHNAASAVVAEKVGLILRHRGPDAGNPDPSAVRLVYSDRELSDQELAATMR